MKKNLRAFSLVEVTLAIGIVSFALLAVMGLLPVGLQSVKNASEQAGAASVLNSLSDAIRNAQSSTNNAGVVAYSASFAGKNVSFSTSPINETWDSLTLEGTTNSQTRRLVARLDLIAPPTQTTPGRGTVSVAWSAAANPTWNASSQTWANAEGSLTTGIQFFAQ